MTIRFGNLTGRAPLGLKAGKAPKRPDYLAAVRALPCVICQSFGEQQMSATTAHHPIMDRHSQRKRPDICAVPLCDGHHQGRFDRSKIALHDSPALWRETYGADHEYIAVTQDALAHLLEAPHDQDQ